MHNKRIDFSEYKKLFIWKNVITIKRWLKLVVQLVNKIYDKLIRILLPLQT